MIIGINGRLRSGKDTVGKIIQYLTSECSNVLGKEYRTFDKFLQMGGGSDARDFDFHYQSEWEIHKYAYKLKQIAGILLGDPSFHYDWENSGDEYRNTFLPEWGMTRRDFLQKLGTEAVRMGIHEDAWVIATLADYKPTTESTVIFSSSSSTEGQVYPTYPNWIISDTRFPNEADAIRKRNGLIIRVNRTPENRGIDKHRSSDEHPSETSLDDYIFDMEIDNNSSLEELTLQVQLFLEKYKLLPKRDTVLVSKLDGKYVIGYDPIR